MKWWYVEADEDHIALQFKKKKGDMKRYHGLGDNGQIVRRIYVNEGYEGESKRKILKQIRYFGGVYTGKENEKLWKQVKGYMEEKYDAEVLEKIYFQSDGGSWMKKGVEILGAEFVLDGFHLKKCVKKLAWEGREEEAEKKIRNCLEKGERKKLEEWINKKSKGMEERRRKHVEENIRYLRRNWKGIRKRVKKEEGVLGSRTESHISHVLSARMSSRPMGWSKKGAEKQAQLRIYWKNDGKIRKLLHDQREEKEKKEEKKYFSASEMRSWESQK